MTQNADLALVPPEALRNVKVTELPSSPLEMLFVAEYADGTKIEQTPEDVSKLDPAKNAFYDVLQHPVHPVSFSLVGRGRTYRIDFLTGSFTVDGRPFIVMHEGDDFDLFPEGTALRLIYHRRNRREIVIGGEDPEQLRHVIRYFIGFQATILVEGRPTNVKRIIGVD